MMPSSRSKRNVRDRLLEEARRAMNNAYAPYSKFRVGAALLTTTGALFTGCNVENASYGATNCAERTAIFSAVAQLGPQMKVEAIAIVNGQNAPCSPCGVCRQVIYEFGPNAMVFFRGVKGWKTIPIAKLLPEGFRLQ
jgi:cytidine deaminase